MLVQYWIENRCSTVLLFAIKRGNAFRNHGQVRLGLALTTALKLEAWVTICGHTDVKFHLVFNSRVGRHVSLLSVPLMFMTLRVAPGPSVCIVKLPSHGQRSKQWQCSSLSYKARLSDTRAPNLVNIMELARDRTGEDPVSSKGCCCVAWTDVMFFVLWFLHTSAFHLVCGNLMVQENLSDHLL